ncbi:unnamed protein product [Arabidopsis thaliana]|uniref:Putative F-box protein At5g44220 n=1 Tax=Arabidopsis thaliana TaxID=3702 RepID=FB282_ARATH|nr:F-box family protein [Arabidopsis thaliana]Q9FFG9.1 RecName: Full=Putative F-box protein At5g44220 [Arabidopsis thaliana]AED95076.1 F-box family protein [Arabidopsis thaliana]BAB10989.1 unnamed protein product [Arabidopsis thaliana]|eukprot:NP_199235.1 F-box family protein [Arabidopsis thaliana]
MQRQRANDTVTTFRYNTRSSSRHGISNTLRVVESKTSASSPRVRRWRKKVSDDRRSTNSDLLPMDLIKEILKRLPAKTLARFLCVSKLWSSIIRSRDLMKLFLTESSARPGRLFFTFRRKDDCFLFSSEESSVATYLFTIPASGYTNNCSFVHGLICYGTTAYASQLVVYNSSTRRSITLPEIEARSFVLKHLLGYDPIDGVYKVLCMTVPRLVLQKKKKLRNNVTDAGELILAPISLPDPPYYVIYYDPQRQSTRKVVIRGITEHNCKLLRCKKRHPCILYYVFSSQVESLMFM